MDSPKRPKIIGFAGKMGSGKTTFAEMLTDYYGFRRFSFGTALKDVARRVTIDKRIDKSRDRGLLQYLGAEYYRKVDSDYWVKALRPIVSKWMDSASYNHVVIDDVRYENEKQMIENLGGIVIYLECTTAEQVARLLSRDNEIPAVESFHHESEYMLHGCSQYWWVPTGLNHVHEKVTEFMGEG